MACRRVGLEPILVFNSGSVKCVFGLRVVQTQPFYFWNQCRKETYPTYSDSEIQWWIKDNLKITMKDNFIQIQSRSMSDPTFSDIDLKNKMAWVWTILKQWHFNCEKIRNPKSFQLMVMLFLIVFSRQKFIPVWMVHQEMNLVEHLQRSVMLILYRLVAAQSLARGDISKNGLS